VATDSHNAERIILSVRGRVQRSKGEDKEEESKTMVDHFTQWTLVSFNATTTDTQCRRNGRSKHGRGRD
jgi:hypothetical protein